MNIRSVCLIECISRKYSGGFFTEHEFSDTAVMCLRSRPSGTATNSQLRLRILAGVWPRWRSNQIIVAEGSFQTTILNGVGEGHEGSDQTTGNKPFSDETGSMNTIEFCINSLRTRRDNGSRLLQSGDQSIITLSASCFRSFIGEFNAAESMEVRRGSYQFIAGKDYTRPLRELKVPPATK